MNQTQQILKYGILDILKKHITSTNLMIQKEVTWMISNIVADSEESMIKVLDNGFFPLLVQLLEKCDKSIRIEVIFALSNFSLLKNKNYLEKLLMNGLLKVICDCIKGEEIKEIIICLEALSHLLSFGEKYRVDDRNLIMEEIEKMGMYDILEKLQYHRNDIIYERAYAIIQNFFKYEY